MKRLKSILSNEVRLLILIFIVAILIRFLYFPNNIHFAFDQARDAYFAQNILKGDLRIIGPPSAAAESLFPGPLSLYLYSIVLFIKNSPISLSAFFRIYNALGVFLVYLIAKNILGKKTATVTSLLYAFSYEQTQYSLFMSHQPLAVIPVLLFYLGLTHVIFRKDTRGIIISILGLGLAIQFHYVYLLYLLILALLLIFRKAFSKISIKYYIYALLFFFVTISSYIVAEIKFGGRFISTLMHTSARSTVYLTESLYVVRRFLHDTFFGNYSFTFILSIALTIALIYFLTQKRHRLVIVFLSIWFIGGLLPYLFSGTSSYYYSAGVNVSILIFITLIITTLLQKYRYIALLIFLVVVINNLLLISRVNISGLNSDMVIQRGMLISEQIKVLDYIYITAGKNDFSVASLGVPLKINTTWSYLFEWYGYKTYGYLPIWSEKPPLGFPGNLSYKEKRSDLPLTQYIIIEPTIGINEGYIEKYFSEENYFSRIVEEKDFGSIAVQKRIKI